MHNYIYINLYVSIFNLRHTQMHNRSSYEGRLLVVKKSEPATHGTFSFCWYSPLNFKTSSECRARKPSIFLHSDIRQLLVITPCVTMDGMARSGFYMKSFTTIVAAGHKIPVFRRWESPYPRATKNGITSRSPENFYWIFFRLLYNSSTSHP